MLRAGSFVCGTSGQGQLPTSGPQMCGLDLPAQKHSSEQLSAPFAGAEGYSASQRKAGFLYVLLCMCAHAHDKETKKQKNLHMCDMKSRHSSLDLLSLREPHPWFPFGKGSLLSGGCVLHPVSTVRLGVTPGLVLFLDRFHSRHFWLEYVRNWRVAADSRS